MNFNQFSDKNLPIDADTYASYMGFNIHSQDEIKNVIKVSNNKAEYFARMSKKSAEKSKESSDLSEYYSTQNSNVTQDDLVKLRKTLELQISTKQDRGNYALEADIPVNLSDLNNDTGFVSGVEMNAAIDEIRLPEQANKAGTFLTTDGENLTWKNISPNSLFDIKITDHILEGKELIGYALQGTYVYKEGVAGTRYGYPDFYEQCLAEKNAGVETQTTLGSSTITTYNNANGHIFYDIADKDAVDAYFESRGFAYFYGVDEENERIFLPRQTLYEINKSTAPVEICGNGKSLGLTDSSRKYGLTAAIVSGSYRGLQGDTASYGHNVATSGAGSVGNNNPSNSSILGLTNDASKSGIVGTANLSEFKVTNKYIYYVVGTTEQDYTITVTEVTTSENDTLPLFTGMYFDFKPNNVSWLKAGEQKNSAGIYTTVYNTLVNCLTEANNIYDLKLIEISDMDEDTDYSEYWKVNQEEMYFVTPTAISNKKVDGATSQLYFKVANAIQNLELLDVGELMENCTTKDMVDGQWIECNHVFTTNLSLAANSAATFDISSLLPDDDNIYECIFNVSAKTAELANSTAYIMVGCGTNASNTDAFNTVIARGNAITNVPAFIGGNAIVPIDSRRMVYVAQSANSACTIVGCTMVGYRRLGTNQ